jgi:hypothetical protein
MPNTAVIAAALTTAGAHPFSLFVDSLDVIKDAGINGIGTPIESIEVTEAGPGGVSSMTFTIEDPIKGVSIADGATVVLQNNTADACLFRGFVESWESAPDFGGQGRSLSVTAVGIETLLDWLIVPDDWHPPGGALNAMPEAIQSAATSAGFAGNANTSGSAAPAESSAAFPITGYTRVGTDVGASNNLGTAPLAGSHGVSLRQAIAALIAYQIAHDTGEPFGGFTAVQDQLVTVDFYGRLRAWRDLDGIIPTDYTNLTINDAYAGPIVADTLRYRREPGQLVHQVQVSDGAVTPTIQTVSDGTGLAYPQAVVSDATLTTSDARRFAGRQIIGRAQANVYRGDFRLLDFTPAETIHAGSYVAFTDAAVGLAGQSFRIMEIKKTFNGSGRQNWQITFGSLAPRVTNLMRKLTRNIQEY